MARKFRLKSFGTLPDTLVAELRAKVEKKEIEATAAQLRINDQLKNNPYFDYRDHLVEIIASPPNDRRGNNGKEMRTFNRVCQLIDAVDGDGFLVLEDADYSFVAGRVSAFQGWTPNGPAAGQQIEQFIDDIEKAETAGIPS